MKWYDLIREARLATPGMSQKALADLVGVSQPLIAKIEAGKIERTDSLPRIVQALKLDIQHFPKELYEIYGNKAVFDLKVDAESARYFAERTNVLARDPSHWAASQALIEQMPLYASSEDQHGLLRIEREPIGTQKRPSFLEGVKDAYCIYLLCSTMSPELEPGDIVFVNPRMPPLPNKPCIFFDTTSAEPTALVGRFIGSTDNEWRAQQFFPAEILSLERAKWTFRHRIVSKIFGG